MFKRYLAALLLACLPLSAVAANASDSLQRFVRDVASARGEFSQLRLDGEGRPAGTEQSGTFSFERPGKFRWEVSAPYEQLILSDGKRLYQYDPDLAQVIERSVDESVGASPAAILFGSGSLDDAFDISAQKDSDGLSWLRARPRKADAGFVHLDIGFKNNLPVRLLLLDAFGQISRIELSRIDTNPKLPADEFHFTAPDDVDVVRM